MTQVSDQRQYNGVGASHSFIHLKFKRTDKNSQSLFFTDLDLFEMENIDWFLMFAKCFFFYLTKPKMFFFIFVCLSVFLFVCAFILANLGNERLNRFVCNFHYYILSSFFITQLTFDYICLLCNSLKNNQIKKNKSK